MANPYYIAPQQGSGVMAGVDTLSRLYGLKQAGEQIKLSRAEQEDRARMHGEKQALARDQLAISQGTLELGQERLAHDKQKATQELPIHQQPFDQVGINKFKWLVKSQGIDKAAQPLVDDMEKIMETGATKADAMQMLTAPEYVAGLQKRLLEGLSKDHMKALEAGDSMRAKDIERFMQGVSDPEGLTKMIGSMFNQTKQSMEAEQLARAKLAREAEGTVEGPKVLSPGAQLVSPTGDVLATAPHKPASPTESAANIKLGALQRFMAGEASEQDERLLKVDSDPYLLRAASFVSSDIANYGLSAEEKAQKAIELAGIMRATKKGEGESDLPPGVAEADIKHTMEKHGLTREEVLERIR